MKYHKLDKSMQKCRNWKVMPANCLAPIIKCTYKKAQQQIKEEAFQDGDFLQKVHQYLSSPDVLENWKLGFISITSCYVTQDHGISLLQNPCGVVDKHITFCCTILLWHMQVHYPQETAIYYWVELKFDIILIALNFPWLFSVTMAIWSFLTTSQDLMGIP